MNRKNIWVSEELFIEIALFQKHYNNNRNPKQKKINKLEATEKIAEYLKSKRSEKKTIINIKIK